MRALVQNYNKVHVTNQRPNLQTFITEYYSAGWNLLKNTRSEFQRIHAPRMLPQNANKTSRNETKYFVLTF